MTKDRLAGADAEAIASGIGRVAIGDIIRRSARRFGDKVAVKDGTRSVSYADLDRDSNRVANHLLSRGFPSQSRIVTLCRNSIEYLKLIFGINKSGHVWVPVNILLAPAEIRYIVEHTEAELLIADRQLAETPAVAHLLSGLDVPVLLVEQDSLAPEMAAASAEEPDVRIHERDVALIMYTSGTTARAKGVVHCHLAVYFAILNDIGEWSVTRDDQILINLPLFHCAGHTMTSVLLAAGGTVHLRQGFDPVDTVATIEREGLTLTFGLPMMYDAMLQAAKAGKADLSSLRLCFYAMAPMPRTLLENLIAHFCPTFALTSGQTEVYPMTTMFRPEQQLVRFGSYWGEASAIDDLAIMGEDGDLLPRGELGEIVHRGPNVMLGYYRDPAATEEARRYGWHHTGDLGYIDADGQLVFSDRKKDMIKSGGENVPSILVEEVMLRHPAVANAAAVGLPHPRWGEAIFVFVTLREGGAADEADLLAHAREHLGAFQVPKGAAILPEMPTTASGKCKKADLKAEYLSYFDGVDTR